MEVAWKGKQSRNDKDGKNREENGGDQMFLLQRAPDTTLRASTLALLSPGKEAEG